ncbi:MAG: hypothetical protein P4L53_08655 [Candidatus Obscuribacterales bacterium]|nr:hypothetical protein [Candidatus Obscuribacterales bacterium]
MLKALRKSKTTSENSLLSSAILSSTNFGDRAEIDAFFGLTSTWETIADVNPVAGTIDAEDVAAFIVSNVNRSQKFQAILRQAVVALRACMVRKNTEPRTKNDIEAIIKSIMEIL